MTKKEQKDAAMDKLFGGLTTPTSSPSAASPVQPKGSPAVTSPSVPLSPRQQKYAEENERVCTIINYELAYKARKIAEREDVNIREVYEEGLRRIINSYETKNGIIRVLKKKEKRGSASKLSDL